MISRLFRGGAAAGTQGHPSETQRVQRRSNGLMELTRSLRGEEGLRVLDLGPTSPQNIAYFTGMAHRIHNEDVVRAALDPALLVARETGERVIDVDRFLKENLTYDKEFFDAVLCWDIADYLPADIVKPVVERIHRVTKSKGLLLAFFHTKDAGPDAPYHRYHIATHDTLELQRIAAPAPGKREDASCSAHFRLQRVFNNRHIENLFHDYASIKFFLGRDNIREVLVVR
ncbi:MAG: methyltransferase domain-containing protein [Terriglobales bacterium]